MNRVSKFRLFIVTLLFFALYAICFANLFIIQIKKSSFFENIAQQQYKVSVKQTPDRAPIYDRNGQPLALNKQSFAAFIIPNALEEEKKLTTFLKTHFPQAYKKLLSNHNKQFMYIKRTLTKEEKEFIKSSDIKDIQFLQEPNRFYPVPSLGHTVGMTNIDNKGLAGIELICNKQLAGEPTTYRLEKDARSNCFYFKKETTIQGNEGQPVTLTLDSDIQFLAYDELKDHIEKLEAQEGSVTILDPTTGDIIAMACYPDFDPNNTVPQNLWRTKNRIITEVHEPGSVMKVFPAIAAMEEKIVTPDEIINCENRRETSINGMKFSTWKACGKIPYTDVIRYSNNIGTAKVSLKLGKPLYKHLRSCGFGKQTGVGFLGEQSGYITPPKKWSLATPLSLSFGYEISVTSLQLACGFGMIANKGYNIKPRLFIGPEKKEPCQPQRLYSPETMEHIRDMINLNHDGNTSRIGRIKDYNVMGKTGTAYLITNGTYDHNRSIYTFAGIIEKDDYKRVIVTFVREPKKKSNRPVYASTIAVPLFKRIAHSMLIHDKII